MRNGQGRRRNRGPRPQQGTGTGQPPRPEQNARMDARVRGNAHQLLEKYRNMARDATLAGDRITAEYYFQYADHYYRVLNENRPRPDEGRARQGRDWQDRDDQDEDDDEGDARADRDARDGRDARPERARADWSARPIEDRRDAAGRRDWSARPEASEEDDRAVPPGRGDSDRGRFDRDGRDAREAQRLGRASSRPAAMREPADAGEDGGMIALAALPPAISRPATRLDEEAAAPPSRRARRAAEDPAEADREAAPPVNGPADAAAPLAPKRRGRPPKARAAEAGAADASPAPLEDA
jgi:hypothetical protein